MVSRSGGSRLGAIVKKQRAEERSKQNGSVKNFRKVKSGYDQAFTLPKGTSAAPIMGVKPKIIKHESGPHKGKINITETYKKEIAKLQKIIDQGYKAKNKNPKLKVKNKNK